MSSPLAALIAHRGLAERADASAFTAALAALARTDVTDLLDELYLVLVDDTEDHALMWRVVDLVDTAPIDDRLAALFRVLPALADQAPEWVMALHYRLFAEPATRSRYAAVLADGTAAALAAARDILEVIAEDPDPALRASALQVLAALPA